MDRWVEDEWVDGERGQKTKKGPPPRRSIYKAKASGPFNRLGRAPMALRSQWYLGAEWGLGQT